MQKGVHQEGRMLFTEVDAPLHTDKSFREQSCGGHHMGESPFLQLEIDMICAFPLDYMHLLCLGVMRRLLHLWTGGKYGRGKLTAEQQHTLSERLISFRRDFPTTFQRKPRGVNELERWKATEFRSFLLYAGPVALKQLLPDKLYDHFLILHVAARILATPTLYRTQHHYVENLLKFFVQEMGELYGRTQLIYNVHSLVHLAGDCLQHGPLDSFSAFPFESYLGRLKRMLRTTSNPLSQISRRVSELKHCGAPVNDNATTLCVKPGFCYHFPNGYFARIQEVRASQARVTVFSNKADFFVTPLKSSFFNTFRVSCRGSAERTMPLSALSKEKQCVLLNYKNDYVAFPLLHQMQLS
ncbi:uncharacterized protein LOC135377765 [Ornithodoros turicata]|uniref:uncharacterized protein LOC135377765 n=1 Tax=Ornithodoros turicata TaxID=34597 RepID=UPI00313A1CA7